MSVARRDQSNEALLLWWRGLWLAALGAVVQLVPRDVLARDAAAAGLDVLPQKLLVVQ